MLNPKSIIFSLTFSFRFPSNQELTRHDLEAIKALFFEISNNLISFSLLIGTPILNVMQNINPRRVFSFDPLVLVVSEDSLVHCSEVDDGNGEGAVHVENDAAEAGFGGESGHGKVVEQRVFGGQMEEGFGEKK